MGWKVEDETPNTGRFFESRKLYLKLVLIVIGIIFILYLYRKIKTEHVVE